MPAPLGGQVQYMPPAQVIQARDQLLLEVCGRLPLQGGGAGQLNPIAPPPAAAVGLKALNELHADFMCRVSQIKQSNFHCHIVVC